MNKVERIVGMSLKYGVLIVAILFAGFELAGAVRTNTQQAAANVVVLEKLSHRVDNLEQWRRDREAFDKGYQAAVKEAEDKK